MEYQPQYAKVVSDRQTYYKAMTTSTPKNQTEISNTVSSSPQMRSFLKIIEYLSLAAFVGASILTRVFPDNQLIFI
ncbi:hypothetical protein QUA82_12245 [Microcoleus sp. F8-D3]